ncbi:hypothetical protein NN6n1_34170 [Shinella zoogloeoides]
MAGMLARPKTFVNRNPPIDGPADGFIRGLSGWSAKRLGKTEYDNGTRHIEMDLAGFP